MPREGVTWCAFRPRHWLWCRGCRGVGVGGGSVYKLVSCCFPFPTFSTSSVGLNVPSGLLSFISAEQRNELMEAAHRPGPGMDTFSLNCPSLGLSVCVWEECEGCSGVCCVERWLPPS